MHQFKNREIDSNRAMNKTNFLSAFISHKLNWIVELSIYRFKQNIVCVMRKENENENENRQKCSPIWALTDKI